MFAANGESSDKDAKKTKPKKTTKKDTKPEPKETKPEEPAEEVLDLASVVKRRRVLTAQMKAEKAEQERLDRERYVQKWTYKNVNHSFCSILLKIFFSGLTCFESLTPNNTEFSEILKP